MRKNGGHAIAVHPPGKSRDQVRGPVQGRPLRFLRPRRLPPGSDLFKRTCLLLDRMLADIRVQEEVRGLSGGA